MTAPSHPPVVISRTRVATPSVTVSTFIGTAQAMLSLGMTKQVPGPQTLQTAVSQGPANQVPASVTASLQAFMKTPQCATTISNARSVAQFTIAKIQNQLVNAPPLSGPIQQPEVAAAAVAAATLVAKQRKDQTSHDYGTTVAKVLAIFDIPAAGALQSLNDLVYDIWGSAGTDVLFGVPPANLPNPFIQTIMDTVANFGGSDGSGGSGKNPSNDADGTTYEDN